MNPTPSPSRRRVLQLAAGASLLPLTPSLARAAFLAGAAPTVTRLRFTGTPAPGLATPDLMATMHVDSQVEAHLSDGTVRTLDLSYQPFFQTGDWVDDGDGGKVLAGGCSDIRRRPVIDDSVPGRERQYFSDCPDGTSLLTLDDAKVEGVQGNPVFAVVQFEYTTRDQAGQGRYGHLPSPVAVLTLDQDPESGALELVKYHDVDTSDVHGLWITCGASLSPWNTHLSSEEYEPDATRRDGVLAGFSRYFYGDPLKANPYHYGHVPEVTVHPDGSGSVAKHYGMGRISHELVQVMPDERTVLMGDDWSNGGLFLFVADRPRDLSAGTLYVARWDAPDATPDNATLTWIRLGHTKSDEIEALIGTGIRAADILDVRLTDPQDETFTRIPYAGTTQWVRLREGQEKAAAFLETHRYAALAGGSLGFTKMEGTTVNAKDRIAYSAISRVEGPMRDGSGGIRSKGPYSGAVYGLNLRGDQKDTRGTKIDSAWVPVDMAPVPELVSQDLVGPDGPMRDALGNRANPDTVATPDNLKFNEALRTLFIGEDSNTHVNNFVWAFDVDTRELKRLLSCPAGAEATGLHAVDDVNGWTYVLANCQHVGDWGSVHDKVMPKLDRIVRREWKDRFAGSVGYLAMSGKLND